MLGKIIPLPAARSSRPTQSMNKLTKSCASYPLTNPTPRPIHASNAAIFVRPVVAPLTQTRRSPDLHNLVGSDVYLDSIVGPRSSFENSTGPLINGTPTLSVLYEVLLGEFPMTTKHSRINCVHFHPVGILNGSPIVSISVNDFGCVITPSSISSALLVAIRDRSSETGSSS